MLMRVLLPGLAALLLAAGCATSDPPAAPAPTPTGFSVDGVVSRGVEPGCLVLTAAGKHYTLQGTKDVPLNVPVHVTGTLRTDQASYCQQGTPLDVLTVTRN